MIKKIILLTIVCILSYTSFGQPIAARSTGANTLTDPNLFVTRSLGLPRYIDTTQANSLYPTLDSCGKLIYTYVGNNIWKRSCSPKRWELVGSGNELLFARSDARNNSGSDMYFSAANKFFNIDSVVRFNVIGDIWSSDTTHGFIVDGLGYSVRIPSTIGTQAGIAFWIQDTVQQQADLTMDQPANWNNRLFRLRVGNNVPAASYPNDGTGFRIEFQTGANSVNISKIWRNGNWTIGTGIPATNLRLYKKFTVDGSGAFFDTLTLKNAPIVSVDTVNYKPIVRHIITGDLMTMPYAGSGSGGTLTNFSFLDGNGINGSVTNPTTTPQLQLSTSIGNDFIVRASGGAFVGTNTFTRNASTFYSYQTSDVNLEVESGSDYSGMQITPTKTQFYYNPGNNNTVVTIVDVLRNKSGTSANGIGGSLDFSNIDNGNLPVRSNSIQSILTSVATGATTSRFSILGRSADVETEILRIDGTGAIKLGADYPANVFTGTPVYSLAIDASGNMITTTASSSGGSSASDTLYMVWTGQSNTSGFNLGNYDTASNSNVQGWNTVTNTWTTLRRGTNPMGTYIPGVSWSAGGFPSANDTATGSFFYFAKRLQERTGKVIRVFNFSWGGQSINNWLPTGGSPNMTTIISELASAGNPHISYLGWMQGENDNAMADTTYKNKLDSLVAQFDAQSWFGKDVPIFIITVQASASNMQINRVQKAIASGQYDQRYRLIDATFEPAEADNIHFSAQGQYNIANKIIQSIYNPTLLSNNWRLTDSLERERQILYAPNINKGLVLRDTGTAYTYFLKPIFMKNGNNSIGAILASTNGQVSRLTTNTITDATPNSAVFSIDHLVNTTANAQLRWMTGSTSSTGYMTIRTSGTDKVTFANNGDVDVSTGRLTLSGSYTTNSAIRAGTFEIQPYAVNNGWFGDNVFFNGGAFVRRSAGFAAYWYFANGGVAFAKTTSSTAGSTFSPTFSAVFPNDGTIGLGGSAASVSSISGTTLQINAGSLVINESGGDIDFRVEGDNDVNLLTIDAGTDRIGIGVAAPTSWLHIKAGTATASTAPLKFTAGTNLTTPESGAVEFDGTNFFGTASTVRYTLAKTLTNTATLDFDLTAVNYQDLTITVTGAAVNDAVSISVDPGALVADVTYFATVTAANTVTVRCSRVGGGGAANPGSGTFRAAVLKY